MYNRRKASSCTPEVDRVCSEPRAVSSLASIWTQGRQFKSVAAHAPRGCWSESPEMLGVSDPHNTPEGRHLCQEVTAALGVPSRSQSLQQVSVSGNGGGQPPSLRLGRRASITGSLTRTPGIVQVPWSPIRTRMRRNHKLNRRTSTGHCIDHPPEGWSRSLFRLSGRVARPASTTAEAGSYSST